MRNEEREWAGVLFGNLAVRRVVMANGSGTQQPHKSWIAHLAARDPPLTEPQISVPVLFFSYFSLNISQKL